MNNKEVYNENQINMVEFAIFTAEKCIVSILGCGEEETPFDYRDSNPKLYAIYKQLVDIACDLSNMEDN